MTSALQNSSRGINPLTAGAAYIRVFSFLLTHEVPHFKYDLKRVDLNFVTTKSLDVVAITKAWLKAKETSAALVDITPQGYNLIHEPRQGKQGGGVAIMTNNKFDVSLKICSKTFHPSPENW